MELNTEINLFCIGDRVAPEFRLSSVDFPLLTTKSIRRNTMKEIKLTQGKIAKVDDKNYEKLMQYTWAADQHRQRWYAVTNVLNAGKWTKLYMHRFIMKPIDEEEVDHKDRDGLNNQEYNMRNCSRSINAQNQISKDRFRGVYVDKRDNRIFSSICVNYKNISLGRFGTRKEAALAYNAAALKYFGENAAINSMDEENNG